MASQDVVAVMGVTGAGKSSFIKLVTGDSTLIINDSQKADTKLVTSYVTYIRGRKISLVDTPGFDDEDLTDSDVLKIPLDWLVSKYRSGQKLSGILYLHRITDSRMRGSAVRNLKMFRQLIGDDFYKNLTLGTTCWSLVPAAVGSARANELQTNSGFWKSMIAGGARAVQIPDDPKEARDLVYSMTGHSSVALQAQRDVVDLGISFANLAVTKTVNYELEQAQKERDTERRRLKEERQRQLARETQALQQELAQVRARREKMLHLLEMRKYCSINRPHGTCDNKWCTEKLRHWKVVWHCCACYPNSDNYWHCGGCGNDCGNDEHPWMMKIDNSDDCAVM